jgi:hypothetical protein
VPRHIEPQDALAADFEVSPLPPIGKDGAPELTPLRPIAPGHPRLCEAGPCVRYHSFQLQMDVQDPQPVRQPDGSVATAAKPFHVQTHHYCYPEPGIETELGKLPILQCNRWEPVDPVTKRGLDAARERYWATPEGQAHQVQIAAWKAARDLELATETAARSHAAEDLAAMPAAAAPEPLRRVRIRVAFVEEFSKGLTTDAAFDVLAAWDDKIGDLVVGAAADSLKFQRVLIRNHRGYMIGDQTCKRTVAQVGLTDGDVLFVEPQKETP